jgi:hypothetical protein
MKPCGNGGTHGLHLPESTLKMGGEVSLRETAMFLLNDGNTAYFH